MIQQIYQIIKHLSELKGSKLKSEYIKEIYNTQNQDVLNILTVILSIQFDPRIKTNIGSKSLSKKFNTIETIRAFNEFNDFLFFIMNCSGTDNSIRAIQNYINEIKEQYGNDISDFIKNLSIQNLKLGITGEGINKALNKKLIYTWGVWKGHALTDYDKLNGRETIVTKKLDGYRACITGNKVISPNGLEESLDMYPEIKETLKDIKLENVILDGEMLYNGEDEIDRITRYNKTSSIMGYKGEKRNLCFNVFDFIQKNEFENGISKQNTLERKHEIIKFLGYCDDKYIKCVEILYLGKDIEIIKNLFQEAILNGDEGLILQTTDSKYETRKVSDGMWKLKVRETADLRIVGFEEGKDTGKNKGTLGMMLVEYKGSICGVGSGFKELRNDEKYPIEHTRDWIWNHQNELIGKIVEVEYDENKDKDGKYNLRHGVFLRFRPDKNEPSY